MGTKEKNLWMRVKRSEKAGLRSHQFMANRWEIVETVLTLFFLAPKLLQMVIAAMKLKDSYSFEGKL